MDLVSNIGFALPTLILIGGGLFLFGLYCVHVVNKSHPTSLRVSSIILTMSGFLTLWFTSAFYSPVIINQNARVLSASENWLLVEVNFNKIRKCSLAEVKVITTKEGIEFKLNGSYSFSENNQEGINSLSIVVNKSINLNPGSSHIEVRYDCPFNIHVIEQIPLEADLSESGSQEPISKPERITPPGRMVSLI